MCGWQGRFHQVKPANQVARDLACGGCSSPLIFRDEAAVILDELGRGTLDSLDDLVRTPAFASTAIYHVGTAGPVRRRLSTVDDYQESALRLDLPLGERLGRRGQRCTNQDHQQLTFPSDRFDLMFSSHVLEHVPDPRAALAEAYRVLRPGGRYVFTVPRAAQASTSVRRAELVDGEVVHLEEPQYHNSPEGEPALVFTGFGRDILDLLEDVGFIASMRRPHRSIEPARNHAVIVAIKPLGGPSGPPSGA